MYFNSREGLGGTIIEISREPTQGEKETILAFINERRGFFTSEDSHREFFIGKMLQPEDVAKYFKVYNLPFIQKGTFPLIAENQSKKISPKSPSKEIYTMSFGSHKNKPLNAIPDSYIRWIMGISADPELLEACDKELKERNTIILSH